MADEITSVASAFAAAQAKDEATPSPDAVEEVLSPPAEAEATVEQAPDDVSEELSTEDPVVEELFSEEDLEEIDEPEGATDLESLTFDLPGIESPVTLQDLKDGFLRQEDYTRKTQDLSVQRAEQADAVKFWEQINGSPVETVTALAAKLGLIPEGSSPTVEFEVSPLRSAADVEAEVERRVAEAIEEHPQVVQARNDAAVRAVHATLDGIAEKYGVELGPSSRKVILTEASRRGVTDLELVYESLAARKASKADTGKALKLASSQRGTGHAETVDEQDGPPTSVKDAFQRAQAQLQMTG